MIWLPFRWAPHAVARLRAHKGGVQLITPPVRKRKEREGDQVAQLAYCLMPRTISKQNFVNLLANRSPCLKDVGNQSHICHHMHPSLLSKAPLKELTLYTLPFFFFFQMVRYLFWSDTTTSCFAKKKQNWKKKGVPEITCCKNSQPHLLLNRILQPQVMIMILRKNFELCMSNQGSVTHQKLQTAVWFRFQI